ncbi:aminodeoxychorismate synthase component I [Chryseobacterium indologenes]|uniref:Aminodeoxychorismate synthase component I n=1 Tax=Chryseobacterium indologenes TaxID=253 RepID=A0AAD1DW64_CHRID|nr:aminodeoxychorismate synthase component I [Chryseobacterium indologenes]ASE63162.1 aminodeoxychorismate synthase component I [Chryseobacterium indologenes]ATN07070.1 aminodeoxychorismate synthase component I [Chryseobacterium indologenes]AYY84183.1 aminodeoxychorismate synthase component I [Chryseobacterium indologenes]AYZ37929.1 aminodeoxychorismate synthase component I [Chryseobacterium indologenes]AZB18869.1 aminodeoxychorismate synthase component I [Chryseobacterium indologenes]
MFSVNHQKFMEMDELSLQKVPYFFVIDFLAENVEIYPESEIEKSGLIIDFQNFSTIKNKHTLDKKIEWKAFPEPMESFQKGFEQVQKNIHLGNSYLVNYTRKTEIETNLSLEEIFYHSNAKYKVFYKDFFVFFSPETFVKILDGKILTYPMKGTIDASIENAAEILKNDKKEKAEHYTVVDLLRNDLSMVAEEVKVDDFQHIDLIKTQQKDLYAMSSEISGIVKPEFKGKVGSIMKKLLPAGSILGAPKPKTLEIIREAEGYERGYYTGVCGWFDGENVDSCVMIRFIEKEGEKLYFKSGGGITHMSKLEDEYQEMKNKIYVPIH